MSSASIFQRHVKNDCLLVPEYCGNGCGEQIARKDVSVCCLNLPLNLFMHMHHVFANMYCWTIPGL